MLWVRKPRQNQTPREAWEAAHPVRENSLNEFFLMFYFLFYPPLALPADILSCNSPVNCERWNGGWREKKSLSRHQKGCWKDLRNYTGSSMPFFEDDDDNNDDDEEEDDDSNDDDDSPFFLRVKPTSPSTVLVPLFGSISHWIPTFFFILSDTLQAWAGGNWPFFLPFSVFQEWTSYPNFL